MSDIKESFKGIILNSDWIDTETKNVNLLKVDSIKVYVGYPEEILDPIWILRQYQNVNIYSECQFYRIFIKKISVVFIIL